MKENYDLTLLSHHLKDTNNIELELFKKQLTHLVNEIDSREYESIKDDLPNVDHIPSESVAQITYLGESSIPVYPETSLPEFDSPVVKTFNKPNWLNDIIDKRIKLNISAINNINESKEWVDQTTCKIYRLDGSVWNETGRVDSECMKMININQSIYLQRLVNFIFIPDDTKIGIKETEITQVENNFTRSGKKLPSWWKELRNFTKYSIYLAPLTPIVMGVFNLTRYESTPNDESSDPFISITNDYSSYDNEGLVSQFDWLISHGGEWVPQWFIDQGDDTLPTQINNKKMSAKDTREFLK